MCHYVYMHTVGFDLQCEPNERLWFEQQMLQDRLDSGRIVFRLPGLYVLYVILLISVQFQLAGSLDLLRASGHTKKIKYRNKSLLIFYMMFPTIRATAFCLFRSLPPPSARHLLLLLKYDVI